MTIWTIYTIRSGPDQKSESHGATLNKIPGNSSAKNNRIFMRISTNQLILRYNKQIIFISCIFRL